MRATQEKEAVNCARRAAKSVFCSTTKVKREDSGLSIAISSRVLCGWRSHGKFVLIFVADSRHAIMVRLLSLGSLRGLGNGFGRPCAAV